jgi:YfiR/HmsC-like
MRFKLLILTIVSVVALSMQTERDVNSNLKARYIFNFANMIEWPSALGKGNFNIGLFGESANLYSELSKYNSKAVGSQSIKVNQYTDAATVVPCHILFITKEQSDKTAAMVKKFKSKGTLIITEKEGSLKEGSIINFVIRNNRQSYELSKTNAGKHKLIIGKQLTELAAKVE